MDEKHDIVKFVLHGTTFLVIILSHRTIRILDLIQRFYISMFSDSCSFNSVTHTN